MNYINVDVILLEELLKEIQRYILGGLVYILKLKEVYKKWGEKLGSRVVVKEWNDLIWCLFVVGVIVYELMECFFLFIDSIKKIVYFKK